ncbi:MAG: transcriptional repressor [Oligoflexia bacterium]|nr:transcriptional repressor [Oligoflexia bacterium]
MNRNLEYHLKSRGLRITAVRQAIYYVLNKSKHTLSAKDIFQRVTQLPQVKTDQASVYRNLNLFLKISLIHKLQDGKYAPCSHNHEHKGHLHIIASCSECGKVVELKDHTKNLCKVAKRITGFIETFDSFSDITLHGICQSCDRHPTKSFQQ